MASLSKQEAIEFLESAGISVQRNRGRINFLPGEAISEDSTALHDAASVVYGLMEKYAALEGLVKRGFRTPESASNDFISELRNARKDVREWKRAKPGNDDVTYVSNRIDELITAALEKCGANTQGLY